MYFSYDYVQDHFDNRKNIDPKEEYNDLNNVKI